MAMKCKVYRTVRGRKIERWLAGNRDVQSGVQIIVERRANVSRGVLKAHRYDHHSTIKVEHGDVDWFIILDDTRGLSAAMTIEFGRKGGNRDVNGRLVTHMAPVAPLRKGIGVEI